MRAHADARAGWRLKGSVHVLRRRGEGLGRGLVGWFDLSWAWVPVGAAILALDGWPNWRRALLSARYIDAEYAAPVSFRGGIALVIAVSLLANTLLCALAFALGRGLALWWS
jgi:hypothetical protein